MTKSDYEKTDNIRIISPNKVKNDCQKLKIKWLVKNIYNVTYRARKQLNKLIDEYDLVIDATLMLVRSKKLFNSDKYLYIQHQNADFFEMKRYGIGRPIAIFIIWITGFKNCFKLVKNIVFYDENNKKYIENKYKKINKNYFTINNSSISKEVIEHNKKLKDEVYVNNSFEQNIVYIGRITIEQKRMNDINKMLRKTKNTLDVWGFGTYVKKINKNSNIKFHGKLEHKNVRNVLIHSKFSLLLSDYEGFSTAMVESICTMTPIIIRDSHLCAKFLVDENKNGFLMSDKFNLKDYVLIFDDLSEISIEKLKVLSENCYKFALKNLLYETFEDKWLSVYKDMIK